jgi:DNA-binding transcriptional MerR regulator
MSTVTYLLTLHECTDKIEELRRRGMPTVHSNVPAGVTFKTSVAAKVAGVHQQTVIRWAKQGLLEPSVPRRKWQPREYTVQDLAAARVAASALSYGFDRDEVAEMVKMVQSGDEEKQKKAGIVAISALGGGAGFINQYWISNVDDPEQAERLKKLDEGGLVIFETTFYKIAQSIIKEITRNYVDEKPASTEPGAD